MMGPSGNLDLVHALRGVGMAGAVLHVGAHPDDEDIGLIAYLCRASAVRAVYWSATRGEGGQNRAGPERAEALGIVRTSESVAARAVDGGEVLYGPFYDFGFVKTGEAALARWGHETLVREIVRAIRLVQPHVVVSRWAGDARDGHGHHQAIGLVVPEAFEAAGDPGRFPDLCALGYAPWQAQKLYHSMGGDWQPGESGSFGQLVPEYDHDGLLRINTGLIDPAAGHSYQELAWTALNQHRSQGFAFVPEAGDFFYYYRLLRSLVPVEGPEGSLFDGLDASLAGLADHPSAPPGLRPLLTSACSHARLALEAFRPHEPWEAGRALLDVGATLHRARMALASEGGDEPPAALVQYLSRKIRSVDEVAARCRASEPSEPPARGNDATFGLGGSAAPPVRDSLLTPSIRTTPRRSECSEHTDRVQGR